MIQLCTKAWARDQRAVGCCLRRLNRSVSTKRRNYETNKNKKKTKTMSEYHKLYTPEDSAVVFIDYQPQMTFGVASIDRASLINNVTLLAKVAKEFGVPAVLTAVETESFLGCVCPQLLHRFSGQPVLERSSMNSW